MRQRRPAIPQRRRIFLGCEGESEQSYGVLLGRLIEARHRRIHIDAVLLQPGAGDPLGLVERAIRQIRDRTMRTGAYAGGAILLDSDKRGLVPERDAKAATLCAQHRLHLIWQEPCHEAFLLRHLVRCETLRPAGTHQSLDELRRRWPDYRKGLAATRLALTLDEACVLRAASVEAALNAFLETIEFGRD
ncbi:RloB domain-containing protein [Methylobacterium marchantiae]|uniref:RloB domain-containing protein n=1 Tax=Methylobacterium marchantiae TaxID=600331 RepID=A0ABW3X6L3_9HYPH|nr:hypothetical protein AIGOOFII_3255 [Methylobacterium marchantiae]